MVGSSLTAALGGLLFGFDTAVISGAIPFITKYFQLTHAMLGWAVSSALIGCIVGSVTTGKPGDIYGRRFMLKLLALLFLISAIGSALSPSLTVFVIFRFIGGLAIGGFDQFHFLPDVQKRKPEEKYAGVSKKQARMVGSFYPLQIIFLRLT